MATTTNNYGFKKPEENDFYSIEDQNKNWNLADSTIAKLNSNLNNFVQINPKLDSGAFWGGNTRSLIKCEALYSGDVFNPFINIPTDNGVWCIGTYAKNEELMFRYYPKGGNPTGVAAIIPPPTSDRWI